MQMKRFASIFLGCMLVMATCMSTTVAAPTQIVDQAGQTEVFYDDFSGDSLDTSKWLIAEKQWGGLNGGVVPANVSVSDGTLKLEGHGNLYQGGVQSYNNVLADGIRTGAAIATRDYYASGSYEVVAKVAPELGACSAIWTFQYEEYARGTDGYNQYPDQTGAYAIVNHEIDIELPTANADFDTPTFQAARFNTYEMENRSNCHFQTLPEAVDDGQWHTYRFDWHTGDEEEEPRVDFYIDGVKLYTSYERIPTNASRLWLGIWFPATIDSDNDGIIDSGWAGTPNFDTAVFEIDSVKITPYCQAGDTIGNETYPKDGWAADSFPEDIEAENYEHIINGDFSDGTEGWTISGGAEVIDGKGVLDTGATTREFSQKIFVYPNMTYTLKADIVSDGTKVTLGVRRPNGMVEHSENYEEPGEKYITFTTERDCREIVVFAQVERYQEGNPAYLDNISFISGKSTHTSTNDSIPDPGSGEEPGQIKDYITNGNFADGSQGWKVSGGTEITTGSAKLASGSNTDRMTQTVKLEKGKTYTLSADVLSCGAELQFGVNDYDGRYTYLEKTVDMDGKVDLTFTTASHIDTVEVYLQVLRYQESNDPVIIKNVSLLEGSQEDALTPGLDPGSDLPPDPSDNSSEINTFIANGDFSDGPANWDLSGGASIDQGSARLVSGLDTDRMSQTVKLEKGKTYTLIVDVSACGAELQVGVNDYNGRYTNIEKVATEAGQVLLTFTTASHIDTVEVYLQVLRYQTSQAPVIIDSVSLSEAGQAIPDQILIH